MKERQFGQLDIFTEQTANQTDFAAYVRFLARDGMQVLLSSKNPSEPQPEKERRIKLLVGIMTARVLDNRAKAGLSNDTSQLWKDPGIYSWVNEFIVDDGTKILMGQGIIQGFEVAGLIPKDWQRFPPED